MSKLYILLGLLAIAICGRAQDRLHIQSGTDFKINALTTLFVDSVAFTPLLGATWTGTTLSQSTTVVNYTPHNYVQRVYRFSSVAPAFTGWIQVWYKDDELNGLSKPGLVLNIHNNSVWTVMGGSLVGPLLNELSSNLILARPIRELALSSNLMVLPLKWGAVTASRQQRSVSIQWKTQQEEGVNHFTIEKSGDGRNWSVVRDSIPAWNTGTEQNYSALDPEYSALTTYYRIRQTDYDSRYSYSSTAIVPAVAGLKISIYPNPVTAQFRIDNLDVMTLQSIELFNMQGSKIKNWNQYQSLYNIHELIPGIYQLRISFQDGSTITQPIQKK